MMRKAILYFLCDDETTSENCFTQGGEEENY